MGGSTSCFSERNLGSHQSIYSQDFSSSGYHLNYEHARSRPSISTNFDFEFIHEILQWETHWFYHKNEKTLPLTIRDKKASLFHTLLCYDNFDEYYRVMEPLLLCEFYYVLKNDIDENENKDQPRTFTGCVEKCNAKLIDIGDERKMQNFSLKRINFDEKKNFPLKGDLVKVIFNDKTEVFGYIHGVIGTKANPPESKIEKDTFIVRTKKLDIRSGQNVKLVTVISIKQYLRFLYALKKLPESPIYDLIMQPKISDYQMPNVHPSTVFPLLSGQKLNRIQLEVIASIVKVVEMQECNRSKICLIEGPPGTGKTTVIANIVAQILKANDRKILICAPSNKAIDSVVAKILEIQSEIGKSGILFNIVRVGQDDKMAPEIKKLSLTTLAGTANLTRPKTAKEHQLEIKIIEDADIIATTLSSCFTPKMESIFGENGRFDIPFCIIDEAGQATEIETLVPLLLGVKTLVLVGDPKQLPPLILSPDAKKYGLDVSLFARIEKNFEYESKLSRWFLRDKPIKALNVQYRMSHQIANWPNKFFYSGRIMSEAKIPFLGLCHYKVFNHNSEQSVSKYANEGEAQIIVNLLVGILDELLRSKKKDEMPSISVITPYLEQKGVIIKQIKCFPVKSMRTGEKSEENTNLLRELLCEIQVNTVDSFQGQERDIIIMSCVRSDGIGFVANPNRLNVSLTRAKHTMILCGNFMTFRRNFMWRDLLKDAEYREDYVTVNNNSQPRELMDLILEDENGNIVKRDWNAI